MTTALTSYTTSRDVTPILPAGDNPDLEPNIPDKRPETASERNTLAQRFARYWFNQPQGLAVRTLLRTAWLLNDAGDAIQAFFDGPRSLEELQDAVSDPRRGYDIHHIVEQGSAREDGFSNTEINGAGNLVRIPRYRHWQINGWFGSQTPALVSSRLDSIFVEKAGARDIVWD